MKHKIFFFFFVAMVAVAGVNAYFAYDSELSSFVDLQEGDVEAIAEGEDGSSWTWNNVCDWFFYGFRADEYEKEIRDCPRFAIVSGANSNTSSRGDNTTIGNVGSGVTNSDSYSSSATKGYLYQEIQNPGKEIQCFDGGDKNCRPVACLGF